ncbi:MULTISPECIES: hypothetical protein [Cronobacter]|uniref:hypothetical protein n=1 Tax=Cronobacter TaxID=413496 RepID=UPI000CFC1153|nr:MULTISPECIES: hypothetical protein [Cronobacter]
MPSNYNITLAEYNSKTVLDKGEPNTLIYNVSLTMTVGGEMDGIFQVWSTPITGNSFVSRDQVTGSADLKDYAKAVSLFNEAANLVQLNERNLINKD